MTRETLRQPEIAELELQRILEVYKDSALPTLETYALYGTGNNKEAVQNRDATKAMFMAGEIENPTLSYPLLEASDAEDKFSGWEKTVLDLMKDSVDLAYDDDREIALYDILRLRYLEIAMLEISRKINIDKTMNQDDRLHLVDLFNTANDEVYGQLESERFFGLLKDVDKNIGTVLDDDTSPQEINDAAEYLRDQLRGGVPIKEPVEVREKTISDLRELLIENNADLLKCIPEKANDETLTLEELVTMFVAAHKIRNTGWDVKIEKGKDNVDTRQSDKTTYIGSERDLLTSLEAAMLLLHENGVHVERRIQGDLLGDPILSGTGLAGSLDAEEGFATILGEIYEGEIGKIGEPHYLNLGWARGLDGKPRNFRQVYELAWRRILIENYLDLDKPLNLEENIENSKKDAYKACVRIFRGTPCDIPGMVYTKDQAYFIGNQKMWEFLEKLNNLPEHEREVQFAELFKAKFDPTNELHQRIVRKAVIRKQKHE